MLNDSSNFTLTFNGQPTGTIYLQPRRSTTMIANITAALAALPTSEPKISPSASMPAPQAYVVQFMVAPSAPPSNR